ncbi:MAG: tetratricopeptide repeat protein [Azoarcus sp.]|nr:tetratricopeptide repeat protein [Azoarcus sp.]
MYSIPDTPALTEIDGAAKKPDSLDYGIEAFAKENFNAAIEYLSAAMAEKPDDPLPCAYLAFICARQGLVREARDFIAQSARIAPERADLVAALGETFLKSGKPLDAAEYLREAIQRQPDLFAAYPAFAQSLHLAGQSEEAVSALQAACHLPSNAQAAIRNTLMQILAECGDVSEFAKHAMRFSQGLPDDLMAARCLARFDESGEQFIEALSRVQARLESVIPSGPCRPSAAPNESGLIRIAFMVGDFTSPHQFEQLYALFRYLPPERFFTLFITACFHPLKDDMLQKCFLLADTNLNISDGDDEGAIEKLRALAPDILVDMNVCAPSGRLAVFLGASVAHKLMWGEAPIAPIAPDVRVLAGKRLSVENMLPAVPLPEIGEVFDLPERPLTHRAAKKWGEAPVLGCLVPAAGIGRNGWRLFAETLRQHPSATLVINLEELGEAAERFIAAQFSGAGVAPERLVFIQARTAEDYCLTWQSIDLGLMPPVHFGGLALPSCLWMGRPCLVPDAILPWSQRPAALLKALGKEEWIAMGEARFIDLARQLAPPDKRLAPDPLLRARMKALGLTDAKAFAQGFAEAMTALFQNAPAAPFDGQSQP